jgi:hypothetical protein
MQDAFYDVSDKSWGMTLFLACTLGLYGVHRYYVGRVTSAILQTLTGGGFGLWWIIDIVSILTDNFTDKSGRPLNRNIPANRAAIVIISLLLITLIILWVFTGSAPSAEDTVRGTLFLLQIM